MQRKALYETSLWVVGGIAVLGVGSFSAAPRDKSKDRTTNATESPVMPRVVQYFDWSHSARLFVPLLALHPTQHLAMFSRVMIRASLIMCSHEGLSRRLAACAANSTPQ